MNKILRNAIRCRNCLTEIESKHIYDSKMCTCGSVGVDGGQEYLQRTGSLEDYEELSQLCGEDRQ